MSDPFDRAGPPLVRGQSAPTEAGPPSGDAETHDGAGLPARAEQFAGLDLQHWLDLCA
jgi:hypothetical protein